MADVRVSRAAESSQQVAHVAAEGNRDEAQQQEQRGRERRSRPPGGEELALALTEGGRTAMEAHYEEDADGNPLIRILDAEREETIAVLTPEELRALTEQTGLPPGLLFRATT